MKVGLEGDADVTLESSGIIEGPGTRIGRYKLLELIGEGGMGLVYLAEQKEPVRRQVALKILKPGMDTKQVIARFEAERQALALLDHSNIARVFDAGTTEAGRPYFVMEYVKGMSITKYCDREKLGIEKRLKLFLQVCYAVQHAHQKGIIHRDIKPSNILVSVQDDRAVPKIIDFGIAKAVTKPLTEDTLFTKHGQLLGTPEYMSPEQTDMGNQDIDTRADIYSLGVVLYELLTGVLPFEHDVLERASLVEIQRILQEEEPLHPSIRLTGLGAEAKKIAERRHTQVVALARRLHRELEWIPLKAMRKERSRRYRSASELADDIQNYLNGAPLIAGPETAMYRVKKFVRKHAGSVVTAALVAAVIVLGLIVSTAMYLRAEKALEKEAAARADAEVAWTAEAEQRKLAEERAEDYRRSLYFNRIALADVSYREGNIRRVRELLALCPADLRGWEWYRISHISDQACMTLRGHERRVFSVSFSPDGKRIVSGSEDKTIKLWDLSTSAELMTLRGHEGGVGAVFGPNGKRIVSGSTDKTIKVWDAETGEEVMTLRGHEAPLWCLNLSPDGKKIISGSKDKTIKVWDAATGVEVMTLTGHEDTVSSVAFSPDGKRIVSGSWDKTIKVWDTATGAELMTLRAGKALVLCVSFSPDGKRIVSGSKGKTIQLWDAVSGAKLMALRGHRSGVAGVAFSPDGKHIVSGSMDNTIKVWDAATGAELRTFCEHEGWVDTVAFSPDGKRIVTGSVDKTVKVWDTTIDHELTTLRPPGGGEVSVAVSPDGKRIISGNIAKTITVWDATSGAEVMTLCGHGDSKYSSYSPVTVAFGPDGKRIVSGSWDRTVKVWDAQRGVEVMTLRGHEDCVWSVAISPDGKRIVSGGEDKMVKVWDAKMGTELLSIEHESFINSVVFSPDGGRIVVGTSDEMVKVLDASTGAELMTLVGHENEVWSVAFSPDGKRIVSGSANGTIKLWDAITGEEVMTLRGPKGGIGCIAFSPDGKRIVSGCGSVIKIWDAQTGAELLTLSGHDYGVRSIAFALHGNCIVSGGWDGTIKLWESTAPAGGYRPRQTAEAARKVVDELYKETGFYSEVIDKLKADKTLGESVRKVALQIANARLWEDAEKLKKQSSESPGPEEVPAEQKAEGR